MRQNVTDPGSDDSPHLVDIELNQKHPSVKQDDRKKENKNIYLVSKEDELQCYFWIGFFRPGKKSPGELLAYESAGSVLQAAIKEGLAEAESVMLVNTKRETPACFFLSPSPTDQTLGIQEWVSNAHGTISSWSPKTIGFYFSPELMNRESANRLLFQLLSQCIQTDIGENYNLLIGSHGLNPILNAALQIKEEFMKMPACPSLSIYH